MILVGLDEVVTLEAGHLAQAWQQALVDLPGQLLCAILVDALVPSDGGMHMVLLTVIQVKSLPVELSFDALGPV
jgi:hypothetical protein